MTLVELEGADIAIAGKQPVDGLDLTLDNGAALAIVGRAGSGKSLLAQALAGQLPAGAQLTGATQLPKRVALLAADADLPELERHLARGIDLLIGDEPGTELAPDGQRELLAAMLAANKDREIGLLILTRDFRLPLAMGLDTAILSGGKLVERGDPDGIAAHPHHAATRELIGASKPRTRTMARPPIGEPLLELHGVSKRLAGQWWRRVPGTPVLDDVTFSVRRGEAVGLLGGAGAGKSALLKLIAGLSRLSQGQMAFARQPYRGPNIPREARARIAFLFPDPHTAFNPDLAVGLTLTEPMRVEEQLLIDEQADRLVEAVRVVGLEPDMLGRLPGSFTAFDLQRLALVRALVGRPSLIILDEPTARLDPVEQAAFLVLFSRVRSDYGLTVLCASREFEVLRMLADRILILERGHVVEGGKPAELFESGQHPATRALLVARYPEPPPPMPPQAGAEPVAEPASELPAVTPVEPAAAAETVSAPEPAAAAVPPPEPALAAEPMATPEPAPVPEPAAPSADSADKPTEGGEVEQPISGHGDGAGRIEPAQGEPVR